jgi:hypothetical protein
MITIKLTNKVAYTLLAFLAILIVSLGVYAYTNIPNPGHGADSIVVNIGGIEKTLQEAIDTGDFGGKGNLILIDNLNEIKDNIKEVNVVFNNDYTSGWKKVSWTRAELNNFTQIADEEREIIGLLLDWHVQFSAGGTLTPHCKRNIWYSVIVSDETAKLGHKAHSNRKTFYVGWGGTPYGNYRGNAQGYSYSTDYNKDGIFEVYSIIGPENIFGDKMTCNAPNDKIWFKIRGYIVR